MAYAHRTPKPITAAQIKRIHTVINILGVSDENYRAALESRFCVTTCKDLTLMQAKSFIDELEKLARTVRLKSQVENQPESSNEKQPKKYEDMDNRRDMASGAQLRKIEAMWQEISVIEGAEPRSKALRNFIHRITGVMALRFLDSEMAGKVINALKAMSKGIEQKERKTK